VFAETEARGEGTLANLGRRFYDVAMRKKMRDILWQLKSVKNLSADERVLFARSLAGTPDERWRMHENFLRSHGLYTRSSRKAFGFK
jgi:hypothetical protein